MFLWVTVSRRTTAFLENVTGKGFRVEERRNSNQTKEVHVPLTSHERRQQQGSGSSKTI